MKKSNVSSADSKESEQMAQLDAPQMDGDISNEVDITNDGDNINQKTAEGQAIIKSVEDITTNDSDEEFPKPGYPFYSDKTFECHPLRENDPRMDATQLNAHGLNISQEGQLQTIVLFKANDALKILDGRSTYDACKLFGIKPRYEIFNGTKDEALALIKARHIHRTIYSKDILSCYAAEDKKHVKEKNKKELSEKMKAIAKGDTYDKTISTNEYLELRWGVGRTKIAHAEKLLAADKDLFLKVKKGEITLAEAEKTLQTALKKPQASLNHGIPNKKQAPKTQLNLFQEAKVNELISLGIMKPAAVKKAIESVDQMKKTLTVLKDSPQKPVEIKLSEKIVDFFEIKLKNSEYSLEELFSAWCVNNFKIEL